MGTNGCSQPASKSSLDSQDFGDVNMALQMAHFHKSSRPQWVKIYSFEETYIPKVGMAMLVYWMIWYCVVSGVLSVVCSSILYVMVWI